MIKAMRAPASALLIITALVFPAAAPVVATPPTIQAPDVHFTQLGTVESGKLPLTVIWPAAAPGDAQVARYELQRRVDGGSWTNVTLPSPLALRVNLRIRPWTVAEFRVRAVDEQGDHSAWSLSTPAWLAAAQETDEALTLSGGWSVVNDSRAFLGGRASTTANGQTATFEFFGSEVAWIAARRPNGGMADVYVDDVFLARVDLAAGSVRRRRVVFRTAWSEPAARTLEIRTVGAGRVVDVDALLTLTPPADQVLVGAGDIARCTDGDGNLIPPQNTGAHDTAQVISGVDGIVYTTGDNAYLSGTPEQFANCYHPTWGAFRDRTRPSPGNHDYGTAGASGYFDYFGDRAGQPGRGFYAYEAGTWRMYALNSERCGSGNNFCQPGSPQYDWLLADLNANPHRCVAAYWHRPIFSTGPHGASRNMLAIFELLYDKGADLVLVGHDHTYERFAKARPDGTPDPARGVRQIVIGTGGAALYSFKTTSPLTEARDNSTNGVLRVDLSAGAYGWEFMPAGEGTYTDSGRTDCH